MISKNLKITKKLILAGKKLNDAEKFIGKKYGARYRFYASSYFANSIYKSLLIDFEKENERFSNINPNGKIPDYAKNITALLQEVVNVHKKIEIIILGELHKG